LLKSSISISLTELGICILRCAVNCPFFDNGSDLADPPEDTSLLLYNPRHSRRRIDLDSVSMVIIFDGAVSVWHDLEIANRHSRSCGRSSLRVYHLECCDCCGRDLFDVCSLSRFIDSQADLALRAAAVHAYLDATPPSADVLIRRAVAASAVARPAILFHTKDAPPDFRQRLPDSPSSSPEPSSEWTLRVRNQTVWALVLSRLRALGRLPARRGAVPARFSPMGTIRLRLRMRYSPRGWHG
jgi:hypothetical protein